MHATPQDVTATINQLESEVLLPLIYAELITQINIFKIYYNKFDGLSASDISRLDNSLTTFRNLLVKTPYAYQFTSDGAMSLATAVTKFASILATDPYPGDVGLDLASFYQTGNINSDLSLPMPFFDFLQASFEPRSIITLGDLREITFGTTSNKLTILADVMVKNSQNAQVSKLKQWIGVQDHDSSAIIAMKLNVYKHGSSLNLLLNEVHQQTSTHKLNDRLFYMMESATAANNHNSLATQISSITKDINHHSQCETIHMMAHNLFHVGLYSALTVGVAIASHSSSPMNAIASVAVLAGAIEASWVYGIDAHLINC